MLLEGKLQCEGRTDLQSQCFLTSDHHSKTPQLTEVHSVPKPRSFDDLKSWPEALAKLFHKKIPVRWAPNTLYEPLTFGEECKQFPTSLALKATNTAWLPSEVHSQCDPPATSCYTENSKGCKPYLVLESVYEFPSLICFYCLAPEHTAKLKAGSWHTVLPVLLASPCKKSYIAACWELKSLQ